MLLMHNLLGMHGQREDLSAEGTLDQLVHVNIVGNVKTLNESTIRKPKGKHKLYGGERG